MRSSLTAYSWDEPWKADHPWLRCAHCGSGRVAIYGRLRHIERVVYCSSCGHIEHTTAAVLDMRRVLGSLHLVNIDNDAAWIAWCDNLRQEIKRRSSSDTAPASREGRGESMNDQERRDVLRDVLLIRMDLEAGEDALALHHAEQLCDLLRQKPGQETQEGVNQ